MVAAIVVVFSVAQGGGSGGGPLNAIAKAAENTQRAPGGRAVLRATVTVEGSPEGISESGSMIYDEKGRARGTIDVKGHETGREGKMVVVTDGAKAYMSSALLESLPEGKKWMEIDYSSALKDDPNSPIPSQHGPEEGLKILERVLGAKKVGEEEIDGVPTTRYSGTLPTTGEVFGVKPDIEESSVEVWVDRQDRVRRMHLVIVGKANGFAPLATTEMTFDYVEFGREPTINPPPQSEVFNATSQVEAAMQSAAES